MKNKPRSRSTFLFAAICWTVSTLMWAAHIVLRIITLADPGWLTILQIAAMLLSLVNAILNWHRCANYNPDNN